MLMKYFTLTTLALLLSLTSACSRTEAGSRVTIQNKGSDTLVNVAQAWAEAYREVDPSVVVIVSGGGSGTGISAMINGTVDIANASRSMKDSEKEDARANGHDPIEYVVGYDALAIFVHKDNPIQSITLAQLADIYGEYGTVTKWSELGVKMHSAQADEIIRFSRQNNSGTFVYFREAVLGDSGNYKLGSRDLHGSKDVVDACENTSGAIGYSGIAYATEHVRMVPVVGADGAPVMPSIAAAVDKTYPIARPLFMYTAGVPQGAVKAYMDWILSDEGQAIIEAKGYAPVKSSH